MNEQTKYKSKFNNTRKLCSNSMACQVTNFNSKISVEYKERKHKFMSEKKYSRARAWVLSWGQPAKPKENLEN
jgi:hypothetical protein